MVSSSTAFEWRGQFVPRALGFARRAVAGLVLCLAVAPLFSASVSVDYFYDRAGRLVGASYDDGAAEIAYLYDASGNVVEAVVSLFVDEDGNGIDDFWEEERFGAPGVDPLGDPDGDGKSNFEEFLAESDPKVADNVSLAVVAVFFGEDEEPAVRLEAAGAVGREMLLEVSTDLETWMESGAIELGKPEELPFGDGEKRRFYRIRLTE